MKRLRSIAGNDDGFVLVVALMIMVILSLIGIAGLTTSTLEKQIAGNDWNAKRTFYRADGGISVGCELVEQNLACATGFKDSVITNNIYAKNLSIYENQMLDPTLKPTDPAYVSKKVIGRIADADVLYPWDGSGSPPVNDVAYLYFGGNTQVLPGAALQMAAGYEGKGKSAAQGGVGKFYDIYSQFLGAKSSEAIIVVGWRHLIGTEGSCNY